MIVGIAVTGYRPDGRGPWDSALATMSVMPVAGHTQPQVSGKTPETLAKSTVLDPPPGRAFDPRQPPWLRSVHAGTIGLMNSSDAVEVTALAINVTIPEALRWTDTRRGEKFALTTLNVRLLPDGHLAVKAYGRPTGGGRGTYVSFAVPDNPELAAVISGAATRAGSMWAAHRGLR